MANYGFENKKDYAVCESDENLPLPSTSNMNLEIKPSLHGKEYRSNTNRIDSSEFLSISNNPLNVHQCEIDISPIASPSIISQGRYIDGTHFDKQIRKKQDVILISDSCCSSTKDQISYFDQKKSRKSSMASETTQDVPEIERINVDMIEDEISNLNRVSNQQISSRSLSSNNIDYLLSLLPPAELSELPYEDPIQIRANGNLTLFGLSNSYASNFPTALLGRVSREEFEFTINKINQLLQQQHSTNAKILLLGCLCCCFSLGCSLLWPTFALSRRTKSSLEKVNLIAN